MIEKTMAARAHRAGHGRGLSPVARRGRAGPADPGDPRLPAVAHGPAYHHRGPLPSVPHQPDHIERGVQGCVRHLHRCPPERAPHGEGRPPPP